MFGIQDAKAKWSAIILRAFLRFSLCVDGFGGLRFVVFGFRRTSDFFGFSSLLRQLGNGLAAGFHRRRARGVLGVVFGEVVALFLGKGHVEGFHDLEHVFPDLSFDAGAWVAQNIGGMVGGHEGDATEILELASVFCNGYGGKSQQAFDRGGA